MHSIFPYVWDIAQCLVLFLGTMPRTLPKCKAFQYTFVKYTHPYMGNWVMPCFDILVHVPEATTHRNLGPVKAHGTRFAV